MEVEDGEEGEITVFQSRAKLYSLNKTTKAWKERGAGNLRINVPSVKVEIDEVTDQPIPGTCDLNSVEQLKEKVCRLIMRQDATLKVILNCEVIPEMSFQYKDNTGNVAYILFTAFEGDGEAIPMQLKVCFRPRRYRNARTNSPIDEIRHC